LRGRGRRISEFKASLVYRVSSRVAGATQRNPVLKNQKKKKKKEEKEEEEEEEKEEEEEEEDMFFWPW
jgi:ribosomal protein L12E/L44/L45/RPP1/RPP2